MPRRDRLQVSLFPFMSILACTIGALMFLLVTLAMSRVEASGALANERAAQAVQPDLPAPTGPSPELMRAEIAELERAERKLAELDQALHARGLDANRSFVGLQDDLARLGAGDQLTEELEARRTEAARLKSQLGELETSIAVLESRRETLPILIDPTGLSKRQTPFFIECDTGGATLYRVRDDFEYFVPKADLSTSGDFGRYMRRTRAIPGALLVLLVREDGIAVSSRVERLARDAGIRIAKLPLPGNGPLDLRLLRAAE